MSFSKFFAKAVVSVTAAALVFIAVRSVPDVQRYLKIRRM